MRLLTFGAAWLLLVSLFVSGCKPAGSSSTTKSSEDGDLPAVVKDENSKGKMIPVKRDVKDLIGNWVVVFTNQGKDNYRWIIRFSNGEGGKIVSELIDTTQDGDEHDKPKVVETDVNGDAIKIIFKNEHTTFDFVGSFQQGFIRGTTRVGPNVVFLTRFGPTDESSFADFGTSCSPPGADVFQEKLDPSKNKQVDVKDLLNTVRQYNFSPAAQDMYIYMLGRITEWRMDEPTVDQLIADDLASAKIWGERWEGRAELAIGMNLINSRKFSRLAPTHLDAAEQKLGDDKAPFQEILNTYREAAKINIDVQDLLDGSTTDEVRKVASAELTEILKKQPYNAEILFALATEAERNGRIDDAIEYLSDVVALPLLEVIIMQTKAGEPQTRLPHEILKEMWVKKHGSEEGYEKHLSEVYTQKIDALVSEMQKQDPVIADAEPGNRTVLLELFTGTMCPQCVAADLATTAISQAYSQSQAIVIRYHLHIPRPDGLVNPDSEERALFYEVNAAPTIFVDGIKIDPRFYSSQAIQAAPTGYKVLRKVIDSRLDKNTDVKINVSAVVTDGQLEVSADVTGIPEEELPACRLRLAIVQNHVEVYRLLTTNGIRNHEFVVRELLGGAKGIAPKNGTLKYSGTMPVSDLQEHVARFISQYEAGRRFEFPKELKPGLSGPISVVAWVQNGNPEKQFQARMVLQSTIVPILGKTGFESAESVTAATNAAGQSAPADQTPSKSETTSNTDAVPNRGGAATGQQTVSQGATEPANSGSPK